jgi:hypothetical protein
MHAAGTIHNMPSWSWRDRCGIHVAAERFIVRIESGWDEVVIAADFLRVKRR